MKKLLIILLSALSLTAMAQEDVKRVALLIYPDSLSKAKYKEFGKYGANTICRRFGSWTKALQLCDIKTSLPQQYATLVKNYHKEISDAEIITDIQNVISVREELNLTEEELPLEETQVSTFNAFMDRLNKLKSRLKRVG